MQILFASLLAMVMTTEYGDRYFLKGVPDDGSRVLRTQAYEALINPSVRELSAPLEFHITAAGSCGAHAAADSGLAGDIPGFERCRGACEPAGLAVLVAER